MPNLRLTSFFLIEVLFIKKKIYTQNCKIGFPLGVQATKKEQTGQNGMQGEGDKGQKGRFIFTPFHTSTAA